MIFKGQDQKPERNSLLVDVQNHQQCPNHLNINDTLICRNKRISYLILSYVTVYHPFSIIHNSGKSD